MPESSLVYSCIFISALVTYIKLHYIQHGKMFMETAFSHIVRILPSFLFESIYKNLFFMSQIYQNLFKNNMGTTFCKKCIKIAYTKQRVKGDLPFLTIIMVENPLFQWNKEFFLK